MECESQCIATRVVSSVAADRGVEPSDLPPLADVMDPDALNDLFGDRSTETDRVLRFTYAERTVTVRPDEVVVERRTAAST
ncbi:MAG: HalOD1 output domain-containing protein [Halosimplex sp.]